VFHDRPLLTEARRRNILSMPLLMRFRMSLPDSGRSLLMATRTRIPFWSDGSSTQMATTWDGLSETPERKARVFVRSVSRSGERTWCGGSQSADDARVLSRGSVAARDSNERSATFSAKSKEDWGWPSDSISTTASDHKTKVSPARRPRTSTGKTLKSSGSPLSKAWFVSVGPRMEGAESSAWLRSTGRYAQQ